MANDLKVLAFVIHRKSTDKRSGLLEGVVNEVVYGSAGYSCDLFVNILDRKGDIMLPYPCEWQKNVTYIYHRNNPGQHVIFNEMLRIAAEGEYDLLLRLDDDCKFLTKQWLKKMVEAHTKLGPDFIISPTVKGLIHPPERSDKVNVKGVDVRFLYDAIGGICRLHDVNALVNCDEPYVSDVRSPLAYGDATGIAKWCQSNHKWMVYLEKVRVKHSTAKQREDDPTYHKMHPVYQHVPYIPFYTKDVKAEEV